jgi:hypothetical protein
MKANVLSIKARDVDVIKCCRNCVTIIALVRYERLGAALLGVHLDERAKHFDEVVENFRVCLEISMEFIHVNLLLLPLLSLNLTSFACLSS